MAVNRVPNTFYQTGTLEYCRLPKVRVWNFLEHVKDVLGRSTAPSNRTM